MAGSDILVFLWAPLILGLTIVQLWRGGRLSYLLGLVALITYFHILVGQTFFPFPVHADVLADMRAEQLRHNNFVLFKTVRDVSVSPLAIDWQRQLAGNLLLLVPLTFLMPLLWPRFRSLVWAFTLGISFSLVIELTQLTISTALGFTYKIFDVDDLWLNTVGALLGYLVFAVTMRGKDSVKSWFKPRGPAESST